MPPSSPVPVGQFVSGGAHLQWPTVVRKELTAALLLSLRAFPQDVSQRSKSEKLLALKRVSVCDLSSKGGVQAGLSQRLNQCRRWLPSHPAVPAEGSLVLSLAGAPLASSSWARPQQHLGRAVARLPMTHSWARQGGHAVGNISLPVESSLLPAWQWDRTHV